MKHSKHWRSSVLGGVCLLVAAGVAGAQQGERPRTQPAAGSGGATTGASNFPAASAATTSPRSNPNQDARSQGWRGANPGDPDPQGDPALPRTPPQGSTAPVNPAPPQRAVPSNGSDGKLPSEGKVPSQGWQMGAKGTLIQLEELAPVEVIDLQERLKALGLYRAPLDGVPGPQTRQALQQYFIKQAQLALQGQVDASALNLFDVIPTSDPEPL